MDRSRERIRKGRRRFLKKARPYILGGGVLLTIWWYFSIPSQIFDVPYATVTESWDGRLLGARIASDGQWRFPPPDSIPEKFATCLIAFEDENFRQHPGVDPVALVRAIGQNISENRVVSGASTLSMQVIRMSRNNPSRTYFEKLTEMLRATRLEARYTKDEILLMYAAHAPFGGNVVGLDAASWRYYERPPELLTWAECAALAVLPNNPSNIRPDLNQDAFLSKRNFLLQKLLENDKIDSSTYRMSILEPLPNEPHSLPNKARHLTERQVREFPGTRIRTAIDEAWQDWVQYIIDGQANRWRPNEVHNAAALVMEVETGKIVAYVGNTINPASDAFEVDMLNEPRNTGSVLKPFLYAAAMEQGILVSSSILPDIPTRIGDFTPENFDEAYRGAVRVDEALQLSLNIPAVRLLRDMSLPTFTKRLQKLGMEDLVHSSGHYGLSLILGGAEIRPLQIARAYRNWILPAYENDSVYDVWGNQAPNPFESDGSWNVHQVLQIMEGLNRPQRWQGFGSVSGRRVAWKTGTSFGYRDAWTVGTDGRWLVVVWTGNASNEGRPGVIGTETSSPVLFEILSHLPQGEFFESPPAYETVEICAKSGYKANRNCIETVSQNTPTGRLQLCSYCERLYVNDLGERVNLGCDENAKDTSMIILPPAMAWYAAVSGQNFDVLPTWSQECAGSSELAVQWIYPEDNGETVRLTRDFDGSYGPVILEAGHQSQESTMYWSVDSKYIGETRGLHRIEVILQPGEHVLTITDENGNSSYRSVRVVR